MTETCFVDTNVLIYARDLADPAKQARAEEWMTRLWRSRRGRLSIQVLQEYYAVVTRKLKPGLPVESARQDVRLLMAWRPLSINEPIIEQAWTVQDRYNLSWWDALIVSAAKTAGCQFLLTEDLQSNQELQGLRVINPFEAVPSVILAL